MKFTNGYWLMRDGVDALFARVASELPPDPAQETISVLAPTRPIAERANTLNQPAFHVELSTPIEGVIRVRATHWRGGPQGIGFPIAQDEPGGRDFALNKLANVSAEPVGEFGVTRTGLANDESRTFTSIQLSLGVGETVYG